MHNESFARIGTTGQRHYLPPSRYYGDKYAATMARAYPLPAEAQQAIIDEKHFADAVIATLAVVALLMSWLIWPGHA